MSARALFVGGTSSNAGKSWMVTAICAWLRRHGVAVAPFKAQNMSNNSYPCRAGGEIGRAQVVQAEACGLEPEPAMNPILLKPDGAGASQIVVNGRMWKTLSARDYYACADELRGHVMAAYQQLSRRFEVVIIEGAGSVSEMNLRDVDLVNLRFATAIRAPWILVSDIERGGVFASIVGSVSLVSAEERSLFRGFAINKFRGDMSLFDTGVRMLEERTGAPCIGVFPYASDLSIVAEDSLALQTAPRAPSPPGARLAIIRLPSLSNSTDFRLLDWADWLSAPPGDSRAVAYDFIILPGSKNTLADLAWLRAVGLDVWMTAQRGRGATIVGICGGYQMLGRVIRDPLHIESPIDQAEGLGLLPAETTLTADKTTTIRTATTRGGVPFSGYEIHVGRTTVAPHVQPFATFEDGSVDGAWMDGVIGTYLHGALEHVDVCAEVFGVPVAPKQAAYDRLADWFDRHVRNIDALGLLTK
jgi:adenosylcobyric acid synthase